MTIQKKNYASVLIAVKDDALADGIASIFQSNDKNNILIVQDVEQALSAMRLSEKYSPDLLISDEFSGGVESGFDIADEVLRKNPAANVIILLENYEEMSAEEFSRYNSYSLIPKSIHMVTLVEVLQVIVDIVISYNDNPLCGLACNGRCRLINDIVKISSEDEITSFATCLKKLTVND